MQKTIPVDDLRKMQLLELDMLVELDKVCRKNNIKYIIHAGSLLGAVRHKGFIPWDDDIDVCFLREEYEKFLLVSDQLNQQICYFQDHSTDSNYRWGYGKIRRTGTTYIREGQEFSKNGKSGIFIDVFPLDDIPIGNIRMNIQRFTCYIARKITYSEVGKNQDNCFLSLWYSLISVIPVEWAHMIFRYYNKKSNNNSPCRVRCLAWPTPKIIDCFSNGYKVYGFHKKWLLELKDYDFEGFRFLGPLEGEKLLERLFGNNFMTPPPISDREQHSPASSYSFGEAVPIYKKE